MLITDEIFQAYLKCQTKCYLKFSDAVDGKNEFHDWQQRLYEEYKRICWALLRSSCREDECFLGTPPLQQLANKKYQLVINCLVQADEIQSQIHALERVPQCAKRKCNPYAPIRFALSERITENDKLLLAYDALALFLATGKMPPFGKLIHGKEQKIVKVRLPELIKRARKIIDKITTQQANLEAV
jgi:hypothetical protein